MKIRELPATLRERAELPSMKGRENDRWSAGCKFALKEAATEIDFALAELDAKLQDFDAYWRDAYRGTLADGAIHTVLDALQVTFEVPTRKVKGATK